jgi:DNA-binding transcriptional regulator YiaG
MRTMTSAEIQKIRNSLDLSVEAMARVMRVAGRTVRRWEDGTRDIPGPAIVIAEGLRDSDAMRQYFNLAITPE